MKCAMRVSLSWLKNSTNLADKRKISMRKRGELISNIESSLQNLRGWIFMIGLQITYMASLDLRLSDNKKKRKSNKSKQEELSSSNSKELNNREMNNNRENREHISSNKITRFEVKKAFSIASSRIHPFSLVSVLK